MPAKDAITYYPENILQWRHSLIENHQQEDGVWMVMYKNRANKALGQKSIKKK